MIRRLIDRVHQALGRRIDTLAPPCTVLDAEDHGPEPTAAEQQIIDRLRATPLPEVTDEMRDRAIERFEREFRAYRNSADAGQTVLANVPQKVWPPVPARPTVTSVDWQLANARTVEQQLAVIDELEFEVPAQTRREWRRRVLAGEQLADLIARNPTPLKPYDERDDEIGGNRRYFDNLES